MVDGEVTRRCRVLFFERDEGIMATPEIALLAMVIAGLAMTPTESPSPAASAGSAPTAEAVAPASPPASSGQTANLDPGKRVESDSFTAPPQLARCIAHNINRKMPHLSVRQRSDATTDDRILLVLSAPDRETFGVIRLEPDEGGSKLTTWLAGRDLAAAPEAVAKRLVAGC
jgi:hypothetical protein